MQLIPSTGVLLGAIAAGVVAAVLVNVYIGNVESRYTAGSMRVLVAKEKIAQGQPLNAKLFKEEYVTGPWTNVFDGALKPENARLLDGTKTAPRPIGAGEPIFYGDLYDEGAPDPLINPSRGYDLLTIPVQSDNSPGRQLQPGGYVRLYAVFDLDPDPRKEQRETMDVIENVQVRAVDGSTRPIPADKRARYDNISILVTQDQAIKLLRIQDVLVDGSFTVTVTHRPDQVRELEPKINPEVLRFIESRGMVSPLP
jgi:Flp pilus assembly protein CpaB